MPLRIENVKVEKYRVVLKDKYRPPSKGGNTMALHLHVLFVRGKGYSFLNAGSRKFVFKSDTVSFEWKWDGTGKYRNIDPESIAVHDKNGSKVVRQAPASKRWRIAETRTPASRREERD